MVEKPQQNLSPKKIVFEEEELLKNSKNLFIKIKHISKQVIEEFKKKKDFLEKNELCVSVDVEKPLNFKEVLKQLSDSKNNQKFDLKKVLNLKTVIKQLSEFIDNQKKDIKQLLKFEESEIYIYNFLAKSIHRIDYDNKLSKNFHLNVTNSVLPIEKIKYELHYLEQKTNVILSSNSYFMRDFLIMRLGPTVNRSVNLVETLVKSLNSQYELMTTWQNEIEKLINGSKCEIKVESSVKKILKKYEQDILEEFNKEKNIEDDLCQLYIILVEIEKKLLNLSNLKVEIIDLKDADENQNHPNSFLINVLKNTGRYHENLYYRGFDGKYIKKVQKYGTDMPESDFVFVAPGDFMNAKNIHPSSDPIIFALLKKIPAVVIYDGRFLTGFTPPFKARFKWSALDAVVAIFKFKNYEHLLKKLPGFNNDIW